LFRRARFTGDGSRYLVRVLLLQRAEARALVVCCWASQDRGCPQSMVYHAPFKQTGRDSLIAFPGCSVHAGKSRYAARMSPWLIAGSVAFGTLAAVSSSCPSSKGCLFYLAVVWPVAALAFGLQLIQALCLACDQGTSAVSVGAEALCGFVGCCARGRGRVEWVVGSARSLS